MENCFRKRHVVIDGKHYIKQRLARTLPIKLPRIWRSDQRLWRIGLHASGLNDRSVQAVGQYIVVCIQYVLYWAIDVLVWPLWWIVGIMWLSWFCFDCHQATTCGHRTLGHLFLHCVNDWRRFLFQDRPATDQTRNIVSNVPVCFTPPVVAYACHQAI